MEFLPSADEHRLKTKSSISQAKDDIFSVHNGAGEYLPLEFDFLDYIDCDKIKSHRIIVSTSDELAYQYPVEKCVYYTDEYIYVDEHGKELRTLPHWAGEGFYEAYVDRNAFINFDKESLGVKNKQLVDIGLNYAVALDTLE